MDFHTMIRQGIDLYNQGYTQKAGELWTRAGALTCSSATAEQPNHVCATCIHAFYAEVTA